VVVSTKPGVLLFRNQAAARFLGECVLPQKSDSFILRCEYDLVLENWQQKSVALFHISLLRSSQVLRVIYVAQIGGGDRALGCEGGHVEHA